MACSVEHALGSGDQAHVLPSMLKVRMTSYTVTPDLHQELFLERWQWF